MNGIVDEAGRALLDLDVRVSDQTPSTKLRVWVDTAFDGDLVFSASLVKELGLQQSAAVEAILADGEKVILETYSCEMFWREQWTEVEVIANRGELPLLGIGLLKECRLEIDYPKSMLRLE